MNLTFRRLVCALLAFGMGLTLLLGLLAPLIRLRAYGMPVVSENGYNIMGMASPLFFAGESDGVGAMVCAFGIVSCALCLFAALAVLFSLFGLFSLRFSRAGMGLSIASLVCLFVYMAMGIAYTAVWKAEHGSEIASAYSVSTGAYLPFLFGVLLFVSLCVCRMQVPDKTVSQLRGARRAAAAKERSAAALGPRAAERPADSPSEQTKAAPAGALSETETANLLEEYGKLYRDGILTEEEFTAVKRRLLQGSGERV